MQNRVKDKMVKGIVCYLIAFFLGFSITEANAGRRTLTLETNTAEIQKFSTQVKELFIANPEVADIQMQNPQVAYIFAKKPGSTTVFASDANGRIMLSLDVRVVHNLAQLNDALRRTRPNESVKALSTPNGIVLTGSVSSAKAAADILSITQRFVQNNEAIVNDMTVSKPSQVYLKVKIAEVKRTALNNLSINWDMTGVADKFSFGMLQGRIPVVSGAFQRTTTGGNQLAGLGGRFTDGRANIANLIDILYTEGLATILAEPNLVAISGETASFLAGGEFPFPVPQDTNITIEFKEFGISLAFTPTVLSNNQINLRVRPEVSQLDKTQSINVPVGNTILEVPGITTRRAETSVELGSGESLAIAGLFSNNMQSSLQELPGLADLPILGALFRSNSFLREETELVIVVTPYLVVPTSQQVLELPTERMRHSSNLEKILFGMLNQPNSSSSQERRLFGVAGFFVD